MRPCRAMAPLVREPERTLPGPLARHVDHCLRCQAEQARERRRRSTLRRLAASTIEPPAGLLDAVVEDLDDPHTTGARVPWTPVAMAAGAAAGAVLIVRRVAGSA